MTPRPTPTAEQMRKTIKIITPVLYVGCLVPAFVVFLMTQFNVDMASDLFKTFWLIAFGVGVCQFFVMRFLVIPGLHKQLAALEGSKDLNSGAKID